MSSYLWKAFYEDDVDTFRQYLAASVYGARSYMGRGGGHTGAITGSPGGFGSSPLLSSRKGKNAAGTPNGGGSGVNLTKADINWRDSTGLTLLHHAVSSTAESAAEFAIALIDHPLIDLYVQDAENGWTALHRAFYFGNVSVARLMLERDTADALGKTTGQIQQTIGLVKVKDKEGNGPLDLYAATIKDRTLRPEMEGRPRSGSQGSDEDRPLMVGDGEERHEYRSISYLNVDGDQLYTFGSNQNVTLGFGDQDNRQYPERINLRRPEHLIRRFYREYVEEHDKKWSAHDPSYIPKPPAQAGGWIDDLPYLVRSKPLIVQDVHMSKLSTAVLTTDPESNLYMCGHGQSGRLGAGDEQARFNFACIEGGALSGKRVATVALGQNHTLALSDEGEIYSWGSNAYGQLGYSLPKTTADKEPMSVIPRQLFGVLKRETVLGIAASRIHSVAFTATSLYTFGKNEGQLGIMDSDARSLEVQDTPRKVAASLFASPIQAVTAIDKATVCLLENHEVWVFANYGYAKVSFTLEGFSNYFLKQSFLVTSYDSAPNRIVKLTSGGDTVCALSSRGEIFTFSINQRQDNKDSASTTNPSKIRNAITPPQRIWSPKKNSMAARDVDVDTDGAIILSTEEGSVWKRTKRANMKNATAASAGEYKPKDYKFTRIPGLTRVLAVRSSAYGAYAAVRRDCDVLKTQVVVEDPMIWKVAFSLCSLKHLAGKASRGDDDETRHRFWQGPPKANELQTLKQAVLNSDNIEEDLVDLTNRHLSDTSAKYDALIATTVSDAVIPVHRFMLTARSRALRRGFRDLCETSTFTIPDLAVCELDSDGRTIIRFQGIDILTLIDLALYIYTDSVIDFWHMTRMAPKMAYRYRQVRTELMKVASKLELGKLEPAVRQMVSPLPCLDLDLEVAFADAAFFYDGDIIVQLEDDEVRVHSALVCTRCPFFEGLFMGRAGGRWLAGREAEDINVDLSHINAQTFQLVLRHMYADTGAELFDDIVSVGVDDFIDSVMDVMSAANELMLDRLSQICQAVIGRFVNVRNICELLNAISPSSVHEFKDAALEYLCLNLEAMLQGHHLNALDEDLLVELDEVVRANQLACMPFAKSGRAELLLHERHPDLAEVITRNKQRKIDGVNVRSKHQDLDTFVPGSLGDELSTSPIQQKARRRSSTAPRKSDLERPALKAKASSKDMMFAMDEEGSSDLQTPDQSPSIKPMTGLRGLEPILPSPPEDTWPSAKSKVSPSPNLAAQGSAPSATPRTPRSPPVAGKTPPTGGVPWNFGSLPGPRTDMKDIMAQTSAGRTSSLSQGLAAERPGLAATPSSYTLGTTKVSQKDRKRMMQSQKSGSAVPQTTKEAASASKPGNPWQNVNPKRAPSLGAALSPQPTPAQAKPSNARQSSTPHLTMRQTVANPKPGQAQKPVIGPSGQSNMPARGMSDSKLLNTASPEQPRLSPSRHQSMQLPTPAQASNSKPIPQSIRHQPQAEPILGLSMSEIVAQEELAKEELKAAVAKRDLQDIQAEQEFQEWWEKESARVQEAEARNSAPASKGPKKRHHGRGGRSGRGGGKGKGGAAQQQQQQQQTQTTGV
ncbi:hypothetical protein KC351_g12726 [Hortaea werneckii]|nr:hypothetical protein KC351_g12726 [Hortaea werneckii]